MTNDDQIVTADFPFSVTCLSSDSDWISSPDRKYLSMSNILTLTAEIILYKYLPRRRWIRFFPVKTFHFKVPSHMRFVVKTCSIQLISHPVPRKNRTKLSRVSQRNEIVTPCRSDKLSLQITPCE